MARNTTDDPRTLADEFSNENMDASAHGYDSDGNRTVVVQRDDATMSGDGVQALAERAGYFVFASDAREWTLVAYADCEWKNPGRSRGGRGVMSPSATLFVLVSVFVLASLWGGMAIAVRNAR